MRKVTVGFSRPRNKWFPIFSWLILLWERTPYSHVYLRWPTSVGPYICYQAAHTSLHFLSDKQFWREIRIIDEFELEISDTQFERLLKYCLENCGAQYGLFEALALPFVVAFALKKNPFGAGENKQYCAELVARCLAEIDGEKLTFDADQVRLKQVYALVKTKKEAQA